MAVIEIDNLVVEFPSSQGMLRAVDGVSLKVDEGEVLGIVGESGSGKSVAMLATMGLVPYPGRVSAERAVPDGSVVVQVGSSRIDLDAKTATDGSGAAIHLTPTEWRLLEALLRRPGKLVTGRALLTELRGSPDHTDPSYLRIYIAALRRKLEPEPRRPRHLLTEPGMGYRFQP